MKAKPPLYTYRKFAPDWRAEELERRSSVSLMRLGSFAAGVAPGDKKSRAAVNTAQTTSGAIGNTLLGESGEGHDHLSGETHRFGAEA